MRAPLSIIIPTLNSATSIGPTLASVFEAVEGGLLTEVIIADGGSGDGIDEVANAVGAELVISRTGRGNQLAAGAGSAQGQWLLFLHADTILSTGWPRMVRAHMAGGQQAGYFQLRFDAKGPAPAIVAGWANLRSRIFGLPYGDQGLLVPAKLYHEIGGYPEIPLMEDVAIARALRGKLRPIQATATTSARRYIKQGWLRRGSRNLFTLLMYFLGRSPKKLANDYQNRQNQRNG